VSFRVDFAAQFALRLAPCRRVGPEPRAAGGGACASGAMIEGHLSAVARSPRSRATFIEVLIVGLGENMSAGAVRPRKKHSSFVRAGLAAASIEARGLAIGPWRQAVDQDRCFRAWGCASSLW